MSFSKWLDFIGEAPEHHALLGRKLTDTEKKLADLVLDLNNRVTLLEMVDESEVEVVEIKPKPKKRKR